VSDARLAASRVTVVGAGRAGSFACLALAMAGIPRLRVYDPDTLDPARNLGVQLYRAADVFRRRPKVEALVGVLGELCPRVSVEPVAAPFPDGAIGPSGPIVLLAPDSMEARHRVAETLARDRSVVGLVDLRLGGSVVRCHSARGRAGLRAFREVLYGDDEVWGGPCADSPEPHAALAAAALAAAAVMACVRGRPFPGQLVMDVGARPAMV